MNRKLVFLMLVILLAFACGVISTTPEIPIQFQNPIYTKTPWALIPSRTPTPSFVAGYSYWVGGDVEFYENWGGGRGESVDVYTKPGNSIHDPSSVLVGFIPVGLQVTFEGRESLWCYVTTFDPFYVDFGGYGYLHDPVEGWIECKYLLTYQPTPFPTPNMTPQRP